MLPYPNPFTQDPEMSSSRNQEVKSHSTLNPYNFYHSMPSPPLFSPLSFNYDFFFAADALPADASPLPPLDPEAGEEIVTVAAPPAPRKAGAGGCRKRSRSDRHSKIHTSQGLRDRRMRLSLRVARRFFRLQDMLGFDKASHTIDWLLKQSKSAIDLVGPGSSRRNSQPLNSGSLITDSSASECEVASSNSHHKAKPASAAASSSKAKASAAPRPSREVAFGPSFTRESRQKARTRARERTIEKKRLNSTRGFVDPLATCECSQMNMNSPWFNMYSNKDEGNLPRDQKN